MLICVAYHLAIKQLTPSPSIDHTPDTGPRWRASLPNIRPLLSVHLHMDKVCISIMFQVVVNELISATSFVQEHF